jgi:hypothetical protein
MLVGGTYLVFGITAAFITVVRNRKKVKDL